MISTPAEAEARAEAAFVPLANPVTIRDAADVQALARAIDRIQYARSPYRRGKISLPYDEDWPVPHVNVRDLTDGLRALAGEVRDE